MPNTAYLKMENGLFTYTFINKQDKWQFEVCFYKRHHSNPNLFIK